jgi:hypothetical protein
LFDIDTLPVTLEFEDQYTFGVGFNRDERTRTALLVIILEEPPHILIQLQGKFFAFP